MKQLFLLIAILTALPSLACTNVIVGRKASSDGSAFVTYSADNYGSYGAMYRHVGGTHKPGEMRQIYDGDTNRHWGEIPQAAQTYNVIGQMNEFQVSICETTFGGREELCDSTGIMDYTSLMFVALERSKTAREAIGVMTSLVEQYGYNSEGETFSICDKNEVWIMEMIGKGPGVKGANWVAVRIPDDCVCAHANQSRITRFDLKDKKNVMYSKDLIKFARKSGFFTSKKDEDFSFRDAFAPLDFGGARYCEARVWSAFNRLCGGMEQYVDYAMGNDPKGEMPLYIKPAKPVKLADIMAVMRDHYEGTPFDINGTLGAGPYDMPYRPTPLSFEVDGKKYFNERPISTQQTCFCVVCQMRSSVPDSYGGIVWFTNDDPNMAPFTPVYSASTEVPVCYTRIPGKQDDVTYSDKSAFWLQNTVSNMVYPYYSKMFPDLKAVRDSIEQYTLKEYLLLENIVVSSYKDKSQKMITEYSVLKAKQMMERWKKLHDYLIVKHNDMAVRKINADGTFTMNPYGYTAPVDRPGYPENYRRQVVKEQPEKYLLKE